MINTQTQSRIGFIIDGKLPSLHSCMKRHCGPKELFLGWPTDSGTTEMRFGWIADFVNNTNGFGLIYELYRPWRKYDAVVFLKSMSEECVRFARSLKKKGIKTIFDLNVDYLTPASGKFYYDGMAPTDNLYLLASKMCAVCDTVLCASKHIASAAMAYNNNVFWLPDNIRDDLIVNKNSWRPGENQRVPLLWSGQALKLFDLLRIKDVLLSFGDKVHLKIITNSLSVLQKWYDPYFQEFSDLLSRLSHEIIPFTTIGDLLDIYSKGGVYISPRFLDNSYNLGHSEWKITLALARGCLTLASEQASYLDVYNRASRKGIMICRTDRDWKNGINLACSEEYPWDKVVDSAIEVVRDNYSSSVVGEQHARIINSSLGVD